MAAKRKLSLGNSLYFSMKINAIDLPITGGATTSSNLHAITITQDNRMYIAGENGTVLYSPVATGTGSMPLNLLTQGNVDLKACSRSEEHTSELQSRPHLVCRLLLEKKNQEYI